MLPTAISDSISSMLLETDVFIHFDVGKMAYRVGQVFDDHDRDAVTKLVFVLSADYVQDDKGNPTLTSFALSSLLLENNGDLEINLMASRSNLGSSEVKVEKIPKPRNMWIIYRQEKHAAVLADNPGMHTSKICKNIALSTLQHTF